MRNEIQKALGTITLILSVGACNVQNDTSSKALSATSLIKGQVGQLCLKKQLRCDSRNMNLSLDSEAYSLAHDLNQDALVDTVSVHRFTTCGDTNFQSKNDADSNAENLKSYLESRGFSVYMDTDYNIANEGIANGLHVLSNENLSKLTTYDFLIINDSANGFMMPEKDGPYTWGDPDTFLIPSSNIDLDEAIGMNNDSCLN